MPEPRARNPSRHNDGAAPGRNRFGTFGGVFTPAILTILGVIMFMRANFVVGQAGIMGAVFILVIAKSITLTTSFSISAISTNIRVRGGGSYFLISRVLGLEFGGAIGIALFLALALSVPFYILGFAEALVRSFPGLAPWFLAITLTTALALFTIGYIGAGWAIRTQYMIMAFLFAAIAAFLGGALRDFSAERFLANLGPAYTAVEAGGGEMYAFWSIFAIYFPAVTGIDAGVNMSGDLRDPGRSIPRGTFAAVGVGFTVYLVQILLAGGAWERGQLVGLPFDLLKDKALFGWSILVVLGVVAATLSSALGSYLGAPRVLQAVSRDRILSVLAFFGKGSAGGDEPRRALLFTLAITVAVLLWAGNEAGGEALNAVAAIITMFFLYSYGMINLAAFMEDFSDTPAFRPRFRYFHWGVALAGAAGCAVTAFLVNWRAAAVAILIIAAFLSHIKRTRLKSQFGDARWGFIYQRVKRNLLRLGSMADDPRNWRPTVLVFSGNPADREILVHYSEWIAARRGLVYLASILVGEFDEVAPRRRGALLQLNRFCADHELQALPAVMVADDVEGGVEALLQAVSIGAIRPNLAIFGWSHEEEHLASYVRQLRMAAALAMSVVLVHPVAMPAPETVRRIDVWWRGRKNGELMMMLAWLITENWEWEGARVRLLRAVDSEEGRQPIEAALASLVEMARMEAEIVVIPATEPFPAVLRQHSADASCIVLGLDLPAPEEERQWFIRNQLFLMDLPTTILVNSREDLRIFV